MEKQPFNLNNTDGYICIDKVRECASFKYIIASNIMLYLFVAPIYLSINPPKIMSYILILFFIAIGVWSTYIYIKRHKLSNIVLFQAVFSLSYSFILMGGTLVILLTMRIVNGLLLIVSVGIIYVSILIVYNLYVIKAIRSSFFGSTKQRKLNTWIISSTSIIGISLGRILAKHIDADVYFMVVLCVQLFIGIVFLLGTHNFTKFYIMKKRDL